MLKTHPMSRCGEHSDVCSLSGHSCCTPLRSSQCSSGFRWGRCVRNLERRTVKITLIIWPLCVMFCTRGNLQNYQGNLALVNVHTFKLGGLLTAISIQSVLVCTGNSKMQLNIDWSSYWYTYWISLWKYSMYSTRFTDYIISLCTLHSDNGGALDGALAVVPDIFGKTTCTHYWSHCKKLILLLKYLYSYL